MDFTVLKILKNESTGKQIKISVLIGEKQSNITPEQFEGLYAKHNCLNAVLVNNNGTKYIRGKNTKIPTELVKVKVKAKINEEEQYINPRTISMANVLSDVAQAVGKEPIREYIVIRGGFALYSAFNVDKDLIRKTIDIDIDFSTWKAWEYFLANCESILTKNSKYGYTYKIHRIKRNNKELEIGALELICDMGLKGKVKFGVDMNVRISTYFKNKAYGVNIANIESSLCDKVSVLATRKVLARLKDIYDVYVISLMPGITMSKITETWKKEHVSTVIDSVFILSKDGIKDIKHNYDKVEVLSSNIKFDTLKKRLLDFVIPIYEEIKNNNLSNLIWDEKKGKWTYERG